MPEDIHHCKRQKCSRCDFLVSQCVCKWLPDLATKLDIIILQDEREAKNAKNTVSLLRLALPQVKCISIKDTSSVRSTLNSLDKGYWYLVFPCDRSTPIETVKESELKQMKGVVLLDATWRKAKKMYITEPSLQLFKSIEFTSAPAGNYVIRKSPDAQSLSTLEACAYAIEKIAGEDMEALRVFMSKSQSWQWRKQPAAHKHS
ncbi:DTW domain-containing protein [Marinomonas sp. C2222]|uniref:tRNA-uridine aminocarboxypropyltransferase n=1 Tax=Marinomonas sargassi TaxID=2984494 RepID=A0ABT2YR00_9GAMM|nr:tRNA-uridine aminocarboxypropyltransferase [Marinomonas sargassi]MCV2402327.1 DTW domain-containing protein [Marinomonas sargassi]